MTSGGASGAPLANLRGSASGARQVLKVDEIFKKYVSISIIDEGIGINEEDIHRITERFFRAENTRKLKIEGTGLGLAIAKHIINQHRGELKITSKIGLGSEFIIRLPKA